MPVELACDLVALSMYDIGVYADYSTYMKYAENGSRIDDLKVILQRVAEVATLFDDDGKFSSGQRLVLVTLCIQARDSRFLVACIMLNSMLSMQTLP